MLFAFGLNWGGSQIRKISGSATAGPGSGVRDCESLDGAGVGVDVGVGTGVGVYRIWLIQALSIVGREEHPARKTSSAQNAIRKIRLII